MQVIGAFFGNRTYVLLFLPLIVAGYYFCNYFSEYYTDVESVVDLGLWGQYKQNIYTQLVAMSSVIFTALSVNIIFNRNEFREKNTYLPSLILIVCMSFFRSLYFLDGTGIAMLLLALCIIQVFGLSQNEDGRKRVFNAALLFGLASTFYPVFLLCFPFLFWMIWVIRPFVLRESALAITGYLIPLMYVGIYSYSMNKQLEGSHFSPTQAIMHWEELAISGAIVLILLFISISPLILKLRQSSIRLKKLFRILFLLSIAIISAVTIESVFMNKTGASMLMIIPFAFILPYGFGDRELKTGPTGILYLLLIFSVGKFFVPLNF